jgi:hypothetical protein
MRFSVLAILSVTLLAGCGRVVMFGHVVREGSAPDVSESDAPANVASGSRSEVVAQKMQAVAPAPVLKAVTIRVSPRATENVASDTPFAPELLLEAIRTELRSRKLLDEQNPQVTETAEVQIDEVAVRPSTNAIVFGYKMMASTLIGDVHLSTADSTAPPGFHVSADTRLTISAENENKNPLAPLYRRFAELTADRLAGVESKPNDAANGANARF